MWTYGGDPSIIDALSSVAIVLGTLVPSMTIAVPLILVRGEPLHLLSLICNRKGLPWAIKKEKSRRGDYLYEALRDKQIAVCGERSFARN